MEDQEILRQTKKNLQDLASVIQQEQQAIIQSDFDSLHTAINRKNETLDIIGGVEPALIKMFKNTSQDDPDSELLNEIKELLLQCREKNTENSRLTVQGLNVIDKSIEFLESLMHVGSVKVYGPTGKTEGSVSRRNIGTA